MSKNVKFLFILIAFLTANLLMSFFLVDFTDFEPFRENREGVHYSAWITIAGLIYSAIVEEFIYRLPLSKNLNVDYWKIALFLLALHYFLLPEMLTFFKVREGLLYLRVFSVLLFAVALLLVNNGKVEAKLIGYFRSKFLYIVLGSSFLFAIDHAWSYRVSFEFFLENWEYILKVFFSGLVFSYFRIRFGFIYSCIAHLSNNVLVIILAIIVP